MSNAPPSVADVVTDLLAPLVQAGDLGTLLDVQAAVASAIGEAQRGMIQSTAAGTITRLIANWESRLAVVEELTREMRGDIAILKEQVVRDGE